MKLSRPTGVEMINFLLDTSWIYHVVAQWNLMVPTLAHNLSHPTVVRTFWYHTEQHQYSHGKTLIHWWCSIANVHSVAVRKFQQIQRDGCDLWRRKWDGGLEIWGQVHTIEQNSSRTPKIRPPNWLWAKKGPTVRPYHRNSNRTLAPTPKITPPPQQQQQ
jgi:hypothetical protein